MCLISFVDSGSVVGSEGRQVELCNMYLCLLCFEQLYVFIKYVSGSVSISKRGRGNEHGGYAPLGRRHTRHESFMCDVQDGENLRCIYSRFLLIPSQRTLKAKMRVVTRLVDARCQKDTPEGT